MAVSDRVGQRPWGRAAVWLAFLGLAFLGPFFFVTYLGSLEIVSWREQVPVLVFDRERHIPFLAWTIVPYWSIGLLYGLALFLCTTRRELDRLGLRLASAQAIAVAIFLVAPLNLTSTIPAEAGIFAPFFAGLEGIVGKSYNLAPSLHIALLVILWAHYARRIPARWRLPMHVWAALIGVSVLTVLQHHFFDVPTGAMLGFLCLWLWPEAGANPVASARWTRDPKRWRIAGVYGLGALACLGLAVRIGGAALWLLWPALSLLMVALAYAAIGAVLFQKDGGGRMSIGAKGLLWPYLMGARLNAWLWTRKLEASVEITPGVRLGRVPAGQAGWSRVIDLTAEIPAPRGAVDWRALPMLDLVTPDPGELCEVACRIEAGRREARRQGGDLLVCCALGFSRSAAALAVWLAVHGGAAHADEAIAILRSRRPQIRLGTEMRSAITAAIGRLRREGDFMRAVPGGSTGLYAAAASDSSSKVASALAPYISDGPPPI